MYLLKKKSKMCLLTSSKYINLVFKRKKSWCLISLDSRDFTKFLPIYEVFSFLMLQFSKVSKILKEFSKNEKHIYF